MDGGKVWWIMRHSDLKCEDKLLQCLSAYVRQFCHSPMTNDISFLLWISYSLGCQPVSVTLHTVPVVVNYPIMTVCIKEFEGGTNSRILLRFSFASETRYNPPLSVWVWPTVCSVCPSPCCCMRLTKDRKIAKAKEGGREGGKGPFARLVTQWPELEGVESEINFKCMSQNQTYSQS